MPSSAYPVLRRDFGTYSRPEREYLNRRFVFFESLPGGIVSAIGR